MPEAKEGHFCNLNEFPCAICTRPLEPRPNDDVYLMIAPDRQVWDGNKWAVEHQYHVLCDHCGENLKKATGTVIKMNFGMLKEQPKA